MGKSKIAKENNRKAYSVLQVRLNPVVVKTKEMLERIEKLLSSAQLPSRPLIGTFHSICVKIQRQHLHELDMENSFVIYDQ